MRAFDDDRKDCKEKEEEEKRHPMHPLMQCHMPQPRTRRWTFHPRVRRVRSTRLLLVLLLSSSKIHTLMLRRKARTRQRTSIGAWDRNGFVRLLARRSRDVLLWFRRLEPVLGD